MCLSCCYYRLDNIHRSSSHPFTEFTKCWRKFDFKWQWNWYDARQWSHAASDSRYQCNDRLLLIYLCTVKTRHLYHLISSTLICHCWLNQMTTTSARKWRWILHEVSANDGKTTTMTPTSTATICARSVWHLVFVNDSFQQFTRSFASSIFLSSLRYRVPFLNVPIEKHLNIFRNLSASTNVLSQVLAWNF